MLYYKHAYYNNDVLLVAPVITSPAQDIELTLTTLDNFPVFECSATGVPTPDVFWSYGDVFEQVDPTLVIASSLLPASTNVFNCVAMNEAGESFVTVTIHVVVPVDAIVNDIMAEIDNETSITPEYAGVVVNTLQGVLDVAIDTNNVNEDVVTTTATVVEQVVDKTNGTFSNETAVVITNTIGSVIESTAELENPETVSLTN